MDFNFKIKLAGQVFKTALAVSPSQQTKGLMGVTLEPDQGMLFIYNTNEKRSFWMKNCNEPLDLAFISSNGKIVSTHSMEPEIKVANENTDEYEMRIKRYTSTVPCKFALELPGGTFEKYKIKAGDVIGIPHA